ncbi:MAG: hypothetical protein JOY95_01860 [Silvibacterium sp.]|nr:hypothetical protein [Silvibacterium sp.]
MSWLPVFPTDRRDLHIAVASDRHFQPESGIESTETITENSLKLIAPAVGYANATALTRVFMQKLGVSPSEWLARAQEQRS